MKQISKVLVGGFGLVVLGFLCFFVFAHAVPKDKLSRISVGMTRTEVESIIGAPESTRRESGDSTALYHGGFQRLKWCSVETHFGADSRVSGSVFHDH